MARQKMLLALGRVNVAANASSPGAWEWPIAVRERTSPTRRETRHAYELTPEPSTCDVVGITQDVCLELQIRQSMLDHIADADDTG
jgi:hypothetical protein